MSDVPDHAPDHSPARHMAAPPEFDSEGFPVQDENGVDLTLIRAMLALSPLERLRQAEAYMRTLAAVRPVVRNDDP